MGWWIWISLGWIAIGTIIPIVSSLDRVRTGKTADLLSPFDAAVLMVGGPVFVLYGIWIAITTAHEARHQRLANADADARVERPPSRDGVICQMIEVRQQFDARLRKRGRPNGWPLFEVCAMTEASILDAIEDHHWLLDGGMTTIDALSRMETLRGEREPIDPRECGSLSVYLARSAAIIDPTWFVIEPEVFQKVYSMAEHWVLDHIKREMSAPPFPVDCLTRIGVVARNGSTISDEGTEFTSIRPLGLVPYYLKSRVPGERREWTRLRLRMTPGDELCSFALGPRRGIVLVRRGRPVATMITATVH